jgi:hypothetical protein
MNDIDIRDIGRFTDLQSTLFGLAVELHQREQAA